MQDFDLTQVKEKFERVQKTNQSLRERKIRLESELETLTKDYESTLKELLEVSGAETFDEAVSICNAKKSEIETKLDELDGLLSGYLDTFEEGTPNA